MGMGMGRKEGGKNRTPLSDLGLRNRKGYMNPRERWEKKCGRWPRGDIDRCYDGAVKKENEEKYMIRRKRTERLHID